MSICSLEIPPSILQRKMSPVSVLFSFSWLMLTSPTAHRKAGRSFLPQIAFCWVWKDEQTKKWERKVFSRAEKHHATKPWCRREMTSIVSSALVQGLKSDAVDETGCTRRRENWYPGGWSLSTIYRATQLLEMNPTPLSFLFSELSCSWKQAAPFGFSLFSRYFRCLCVFLLFCLGNGAERLTFTRHVSVTHEANSLMCPWGRRSLKIKPLWIPGFLSVFFFSFQLRNNFLLFSRNFHQSHISLKPPLRSIHGKCWLPKMGTVKSQHHPVENSWSILHHWPKSGRAVLCRYPSCPTVKHTAFWDELDPLLQLKIQTTKSRCLQLALFSTWAWEKSSFQGQEKSKTRGGFPEGLMSC